MVLWTVVAAFFLNFAGPHITHLGNDPEPTFEIGLSQPWLVLHPQYVNNTRYVRALAWYFQSTAFLSGIVAFVGGSMLFLSRGNRGARRRGKANSHGQKREEIS
jgi:hypothetical protein